MTTIAPERSLEQRREALIEANRVRVARAAWKKDAKAGRASAKDVLLEPPQVFETMKVLDLLLAAPKIGRVKASQMLRRADVSPSKTVGGLTDRQRHELAVLLEMLGGRR